jgi:hypothetical protein
VGLFDTIRISADVRRPATPGEDGGSFFDW